MANDVTITTAEGDIDVATDEVGGKHYQLIKLVAGLEDSAVRLDGDATYGLDVDVTRSALPDGAATEATQLSLLTSLQLLDDVVYAEDTQALSANKGIAILAVRRDSDTSLVDADNDHAQLQVNAQGSLKVAITSGAGSGGTSIADEAAFTMATTSITPIGAVYNSSPDTLTTGKAGALQMTAARGLHAHIVDAAGATITPSSDYTHDAPLTVGTTAGPAAMFRASSAADAAVADQDAVLGVATLTGKQVVIPYATPAQTWKYAAAAGGLVNTTGVTAAAAGGAGVRHYVTSAQIVNSHQTIGTEVLIRDGASGTVMHRSWAQFTGGGGTYKFDPPLRGTANTLVEIAEVTATGAAGVLVNLQGYSAAE